MSYEQPKGEQIFVAVQQPQLIGKPARREWSHGLCECTSDITACLCAVFLPWCYMYKIYSDAGEGCCSCFWGGLLPLRIKVRTERGIQGSICEDVWVASCFPCCAMIQVGTEISSTPALI